MEKNQIYPTKKGIYSDKIGQKKIDYMNFKIEEIKQLKYKTV